MKQLVYLLLILGLLAGMAQAGSIEVIQLNNRPAAEIIPLVEPMLDADGSVTGQGFKLIVRTSDANLQQIKQLVAELDTAAQQLLVSVFQGNERDLRALGVSGSFQYQDKNAEVSIGGTDTSKGGGSVQYSTRGATVSGNTLSTRGRLSDNPVHQLRISEGSEGYIETGESIPYFSGGVWLGRRGTAVEGGVDYKDIHTGFYVLPRVHGEQVTLEVSPYKQSRSKSHGGAIDSGSAATTISGPLGQWLQIGGITEQTERTGTSVGSRVSTQSRTNESIWIKADVIQ